jgi:hypothetical protein
MINPILQTTILAWFVVRLAISIGLVRHRSIGDITRCAIVNLGPLRLSDIV